jgi:DNA sulfur modification protein DndC
MVSLVKNGLGWLEPLLNFRNELVTERNILENRSKYRRNGQVAVNDLGVYNDIYRAKLLRGLLETQREIQTKFKKPYVELITNQELIAVQVIWYRDGIFDFKVGEIYSSIFGKNIDLDTNKDRHDKEKAILKDVCSEDLENYELICELLELQKSKTLLMNNYGLQNDLENRIEFFIKSKK